MKGFIAALTITLTGCAIFLSGMQAGQNNLPRIDSLRIQRDAFSAAADKETAKGNYEGSLLLLDYAFEKSNAVMQCHK